MYYVGAICWAHASIDTSLQPEALWQTYYEERMRLKATKHASCKERAYSLLELQQSKLGCTPNVSVHVCI